MQTDLKVWSDHFAYHAERRATLPELRAGTLAPTERDLVADSIATFQLGAHFDGRTLLQTAGRYAADNNAPLLKEIVRMLIAEEQHHAVLLGAFMHEQRIPPKRSHWSHRAFRVTRLSGGFEFQVRMLAITEVIGIVCYRALEHATSCPQLRSMCRTFIADELAHLGLLSDLLRSMQEHRPAPLQSLARLAHRMMLAGAALVAWRTHRRVLHAGGHSLLTFMRACRDQFAFHLEPTQRRTPDRTTVTSLPS
jgi:hypothetical protein